MALSSQRFQGQRNGWLLRAYEGDFTEDSAYLDVSSLLAAQPSSLDRQIQCEYFRVSKRKRVKKKKKLRLSKE